MKKPVKETLKLAVEQLFVRVHGDLFNQIYAKEHAHFKLSELTYDEKNEGHVNLVAHCKEKIGYAPVATNQDIFSSIIRVYCDAKEKEIAKTNSKRK